MDMKKYMEIANKYNVHIQPLFASMFEDIKRVGGYDKTVVAELLKCHMMASLKTIYEIYKTENTEFEDFYGFSVHYHEENLKEFKKLQKRQKLFENMGKQQ